MTRISWNLARGFGATDSSSLVTGFFFFAVGLTEEEGVALAFAFALAAAVNALAIFVGGNRYGSLPSRDFDPVYVIRGLNVIFPMSAERVPTNVTDLKLQPTLPTPNGKAGECRERAQRCGYQYHVAHIISYSLSRMPRTPLYGQGGTTGKIPAVSRKVYYTRYKQYLLL